MSHTYLCGGVFFFLLSQATYKNGSSRDHRNGIKDIHSNPIVTMDLITALSDGSFYPVAEKDISNYRNCKSEGSINVPFNDVSFAQSYDNLVQNKYSNALNRMLEFTNKHIDDSKSVWLVKALLDVIENDNDILESSNFYIQEKDGPLTKSDLKNITDFSLQPFLVGVLHYILMYRRNKNKLGLKTLDRWSSQNKRKARIYNGDAGSRITRNINVVSWNPAEVLEVSVSHDKKHDFPKEGLTPHKVIENRIIQIGQVMSNVFSGIEKSIADEILANNSNNALSEEDKILLQEFTSDYDDIALILVSENYSVSLIEMEIQQKIKELYTSKWHTKSDQFHDPTLKSYVFGLLGELNAISNSFITDSDMPPLSIRKTRAKIRNLYVKLHPERFVEAFPYDAFIDDWNDGEF